MPYYLDWTAEGSSIDTIVMVGAGGKAFCAGGDVASIYHEGISKTGTLPADFFYEEYQLNHLIATAYERAGVSQVSIWDGVTMGGGVGLSLHGKYRIANGEDVVCNARNCYLFISRCWWYVGAVPHRCRCPHRHVRRAYGGTTESCRLSLVRTCHALRGVRKYTVTYQSAGEGRW